MPEEETMNRIKEHLEKRELPPYLQVLKSRTKGDPMPTFRSDGRPITMVNVAVGIGMIIGSYIACGDVPADAAELAAVGDFMGEFSTPEELRDAIWGPQD
jgi:hypothetical protein